MDLDASVISHQNSHIRRLQEMGQPSLTSLIGYAPSSAMLELIIVCFFFKEKYIDLKRDRLS